MSDKSDLSDCPSEHLLHELSKRYRCYVFVGCQPKGKDSSDMTFCTTGHIHECIGLAEMAKQMISLGGPES